MTNFISPKTADRVEQIILDHCSSTSVTWILDAAETILAENLVIDRAELPEVVHDPANSYITVGGLRIQNDADPDRCRLIALDYLAAAAHLERRDTEEAAQEKRRREIYVSLGGDREHWRHVGPNAPMRAAIDRIMELADGTP